MPTIQRITTKMMISSSGNHIKLENNWKMSDWRENECKKNKLEMGLKSQPIILHIDVVEDDIRKSDSFQTILTITAIPPSSTVNSNPFPLSTRAM